MQYKVFGCKVNKYYTDEWLNSEYLRDKSGIFIASCVVTDNAKKKWIKFVLNELKNINENDKIYISGCGAFEKGEENTEFFETYNELNQFKDKIKILPESPNLNKKKWNNKKSISADKLSNLKNKLNLTTKKFLVIQGGCDSYCTFCLTVIKRGKHYYRAKEDIVQDIIDFELEGGKEVVLTGVNLCAWGLGDTNDYKNSRFAEILEYILDKTDIPRLRISSIGPEFMCDKTLKLFENKRIYPHFHFSIQSGSSNILKAMKRHYNGEYMRDLLKKTLEIKRDDGVSVSIGADLIVGFPGENEEDFLDTYNLVKDFNITKIHGFPFSNHTLGESVPASYFKNQVDEKIKKQRLNKLLSLGDEVRKNFIKSQIGKEFEVLIEVVNGDSWKGWTQNYIECTPDNFEIISGKVGKNEIIRGVLK